MVGFGANRRGGRLPSFILIGLMVILILLCYNYWNLSRLHSRAMDELAETHAQVKRTDAARSRLEKRNSELMLQVRALYSSSGSLDEALDVLFSFVKRHLRMHYEALLSIKKC